MGGLGRYTVDGDGRKTSHIRSIVAMREAARRSRASDTKVYVSLTYVTGVVLAVFFKGKMIP